MKKRMLSIGLFVALISLLASCSGIFGSEKTDVRFQNNTDFTLFYGVKFGDAEYIGSVPPGFISNYYSIEAGTYSLQARDSSGKWVTISTRALTVESGKGYTIRGTGTGGTYYWGLIQDY